MRVVCFGNVLHGDDGFGQHVLRRLHERGDVAAVDAGTAGLSALPYFEGCVKAVLVDAVRTGARIGTVHRLVPSDLESPGGEMSLHDLGVASPSGCSSGPGPPAAGRRPDRSGGR
jgi:hydrogenase maturation protease